jgi:hypothetical protein
MSANVVPNERRKSLGPTIVLAAGGLTVLVSGVVRLYREVTLPLAIFLLTWGIGWYAYIAWERGRRPS